MREYCDQIPKHRSHPAEDRRQTRRRRNDPNNRRKNNATLLIPQPTRGIPSQADFTGDGECRISNSLPQSLCKSLGDRRTILLA